MPKFNISVPTSFESPYETNPSVPENLTLDTNSLLMFKKAGWGVSFTGVVHLPDSKLYLNPLVATRRGNENIGVLDAAYTSNIAGIIEARQIPISILHPNLTPQLRAKAGLSSGHTQICLKLGLSEDKCIGFSVTKGESSRMGLTSRTLNSDKFRVAPLKIDSIAIRKMMMKHGLLQPRYGDGGMTKQWAYAIAAVLERSSLGKCTHVTSSAEAYF